MENQSADSISRILAIVMEILEEIRSLKEHRSVLEGDPMLEFSEVCQMLRQSERQVRRYREQGRLVGFTFGHRRMYLLSAFEITKSETIRLNSKTMKFKPN